MKRKVKTVLLVIACVLVVGFVVLFSLYFKGLTDIRHNPKPNGEQVKVACVGDSVTYGFGITNRAKYNYPKVLGDQLGEKYCVANFGVSGNTVQDTGDQPYTASKYYQQSLEYNPDIVVFMLGSNDSKAQNWTDEVTWRSAYEKLVEKYQSLDSKPTVYLCTLATAYYKNDKITSGDMSYGIKYENIQKMNKIIKSVAEDKGLTLIDVNTATSGHREWFVGDGVHPSKVGASKIKDAVYSKLTGEALYS